jgi:hypothetical protein
MNEKKITMNETFIRINLMAMNFLCWFSDARRFTNGSKYNLRLLLQENITQFLDINFNYQGRKSETSQAIHTGNIQLRAYFLI